MTDPDGTAPGTYALRKFGRGETDAAAFLVHLGRAFITSVTLQVIPNYYLQLTCLFPEVTDLFAAPAPAGTSSEHALSTLLDTYGRVEVLWFPYTPQAFVQCNCRQDTAIQPQVPGPYNYPWMNDISPWENRLIKAALIAHPTTTPLFTNGECLIAQMHQTGAVLNGTARDLEIYLKDTTLRVTLFGWALQLPRADVQLVANQFHEKFQSMLDTAEAAGIYPINAAVEIRFNQVDDPAAVTIAGATPPALAATHSVDPQNKSLDTVMWINVGTIPGTPGAFEFLTELEAWLMQTWGTQQPNRLRPEWSKGWAYTADGPWQNVEMMATIRDAYDQPADAPLTFSWAAATLAKYDAAHIFTNQLLDDLFTT